MHAVPVLMKERVSVPSEKLFKVGKLKAKPIETRATQQREEGREEDLCLRAHTGTKHRSTTHAESAPTTASPRSPTAGATEGREVPLSEDSKLLQPSCKPHTFNSMKSTYLPPARLNWLKCR